MANYIDTQVVVTGPAESISSFKSSFIIIEKDGSYEFTFQNLVPIPPELGHLLWHEDEMYRWYMENWGCNGPCEPCGPSRIEETDGKLILYFSTMWNAPFNFFDTIRFQFPDLTFRVASHDVCDPGTEGAAIFCNEISEWLPMNVFEGDEMIDEIIMRFDGDVYSLKTEEVFNCWDYFNVKERRCELFIR